MRQRRIWGWCALCLVMLALGALVVACGGGGGGSTGSSGLVWDQGNWDENNWQ